MKLLMKQLVETTPYGLGRLLAAVPFRFRLGAQYEEFDKLLTQGRVDDAYIIEKISAIFDYAKCKFTFYQNLYRDAGVIDLEIRTLADIELIPVVTKSMIKAHYDEFDGPMKLKTSGTSGAPLDFYVDKNAFAREWAHMHKIWAMRGYNYRDAKLTLRGKDLGGKTVVYNPVHNEFIVNKCRPVSEFLYEIVELVTKHNIKFVHGFPSAIYIFFKELEVYANDTQKAMLKTYLRTCLFGSEFPAPYMVDYLSKEWGLNHISWYGHSEMCVLAYDEFSNNVYTPYHTYGYSEVYEGRLLGTSFHNFDMPLIRYDTGDLVTAKKNENGLLESFSIEEGRAGDFVVDRTGKTIPLTGLIFGIFGRNNEIFGQIDCIQVRQKVRGCVELLVTSSKAIDERRLLSTCDLSNVNMDFSIKVIPEPILTVAGKMLLKVPA